MAAINSASYIPDRKVWGGGVVSLVAFVIAIMLKRWAGWDIPSEVIGLWVGIAYGAGSYLIPASLRDFLERLDGAAKEAAKSHAVNTEVVMDAAAVVKESVVRAEAAKP